MPKNKLINLLPQEEFDASITGRVLKWATGTFRIIVIITEMIVMVAFLSRFWLDAKNSDLNDSIKTKTAQIVAQAGFEKQYKNIQKKINIFKQINSTFKNSNKLTLVASKLPQDVVLSGISFSDSSMQIKGTSSSEISVAQFIANLKNEKLFQKIDLKTISSAENDSSLTSFVIAINL